MTNAIISTMHGALRRVASVLMVCAVMLLSLTGCHASKGVAKGARAGHGSIEVRKGDSGATQALLSEAGQWIGTSYKYGGNTKSGVDCSGLVVQLYLKALDIKLPRSSAQIQQYCQPINRSELIKGDLLFFSSGGRGGRVNHVGMYIGDDRMVHASSSQGVMISGISEPYFQRTYVSSGRVPQYYSMVKRSGAEQESSPTPNGQKEKKKDKKKEKKKDKKKSKDKPSVTPGTQEVPVVLEVGPDLKPIHVGGTGK